MCFYEIELQEFRSFRGTLRFFADFTITTRKEVGIIFAPDLKMLFEPLAESGKPNLVRKILFF